MLNQQIKNWLVIEKTSPPETNINKSKSVWWKCQCIECGNIKSFNGSELRLNRIGACRHEAKAKAKIEDEKKRTLKKKIESNNLKLYHIPQENRRTSVVVNEINNRYGKLMVKSFAYIKNGKAYWNCQCDCGKEVAVLGASLRSNQIHSCGCLRSYKEYQIANYLDFNNIDYKREYSFSDLIDNGPLRFDFALFKKGNLVGLIEYNGEQHYSKPERFNHYGLLQLHDKMKIEYCKNNNIPLLILNKNNYNLDNIKKWYLSL